MILHTPHPASTASQRAALHNMVQLPDKRKESAESLNILIVLCYYNQKTLPVYA